VNRQALSQMATNVHQLGGSPAGAGLAKAAGVAVDRRGVRLALVVSLDLIEGTTTRAAGIEDLVQKGQEGEFWGEDTLAVRVIAGQEVGGNPVGAKAFQVMERLLAQGGVDFLERRVKPAKERSGDKHVSVYIQILCLTVKHFSQYLDE
jgi:hypothetical protein